MQEPDARAQTRASQGRGAITFIRGKGGGISWRGNRRLAEPSLRAAALVGRIRHVRETAAIRGHAAAVAFLLAVGTGTPRADEVCDSEHIGADEATIRAFTADVQRAVASGDPAQIAALAYFPIRVNSRDSRYHQVRTLVIRNANELATHAAAFATAKFRKRVRQTGPGDLICPPGEIGFADGVLWARVVDGRLLITTINNDEFTWPGMAAGELLRCRTSDRLIVIDRPRHRLRWRAWKTGRSFVAKPDEIDEHGREKVEGTGACTHRIWTFILGKKRYAVWPEEGCSDNQTPPGRVGQVLLEKGEAVVRSWDCMGTGGGAP